MKARAVPLPAPVNKHPNLKILLLLPGDDEGVREVWFKRTLSVAQVKIASVFARKDFRPLVMAFAQGSIEHGDLKTLTFRSAEMVNACWSDLEMELEAGPEQGPEAILGELWEAGWDEYAICMTAIQLMPLLIRTQGLTSNAQVRVNFTLPRPDTGKESSSDSVENPAGTLPTGMS